MASGSPLIKWSMMEIVRGQVPNDANVMLEKTQVHSPRIVVVQITEGSAVIQLSDFSNRAREQECVIHHDFQVLTRGQLDEFGCLRGGGGERFFHEYMFSMLERG